MRRLQIPLALFFAAGLAAAADGDPVIGLVWWPVANLEADRAFGRDTEECLAAALEAEAPGIRVVSQQLIRAALYPRLEPATQPASPEAFAELLARGAVQERLSALGLTHLVAFSGGSEAPPFEGGIFCGGGFGAGGCFGFAWRNEDTHLYASLWDLDERRQVFEEKVHKEGSSYVPAFILPIPLLADTHASACRELGARIARDVLGLERLAPAPGR